MSYLAAALTKLMDARGLKNVELANTTGIDQATISRWRNGLQKSITDEDLSKLSHALAQDRREQAEILAARMKDVGVGPGSEFIQVLVAGEAITETGTATEKKLSPQMERSFEILRRHVDDVDLRNIILHLATAFERLEGAEASSESEADIERRIAATVPKPAGAGKKKRSPRS